MRLRRRRERPVAYPVHVEIVSSVPEIPTDTQYRYRVWRGHRGWEWEVGLHVDGPNGGITKPVTGSRSRLDSRAAAEREARTELLTWHALDAAEASRDNTPWLGGPA